MLPGFISYSTIDKHVAADVRAVLRDLGVDCFLAHDDLYVSEEWRRRILAELRRCKVFVALLSTSFKASEWAPQELGFVLARRGVLIIPVTLDDTLPFGFASDLQGRRLPKELSKEFFLPPLKARFPRNMIATLTDSLSRARSYRGAEALMRPLIDLFQEFTGEEINRFVDSCTGNNEIWDAALCKSEFIPQFIDLHRNKIDRGKLKELAELIDYGEP